MGSKFSMTGIILAGGKSSRMGRDKALLKFGEKTILEHLIHLSGRTFNETLVVTNDQSKLEGLDLGNAHAYEDLIKEQGPLAALYTGLVYSKNPNACVLTCDMPSVDDFILNELAEFWEVGYDAICIEEPEGNYQPFPGIYRRSCREMIKLLIDRGENAMTYFLQVATVKSLVLEKEKIGVLTNMNYIQDYYQVLKEKERRCHE